MASETREYYLARADEERASADIAPNPSLKRVHGDLADMYDRMAEEAERELEPELAG